MRGQAPTTRPGGPARAVSSRCSRPSPTPRVDDPALRLASRLREALCHGDVLLSCEPTAEVILGAVGLTYLAHADASQVRLGRLRACQPRLGEQDLELTLSDGLSELGMRVYRGFERTVSAGCARAQEGSCGRCGGSCARRVIYACASDDPDAPQAVHAYIRLGFSRGAELRMLGAHPDVLALEALARRVANECEHTRQFVRFSQTVDGTLLAAFSPNANTIPLTAGHFAARMGGERFCLLDPTHLVACLHEPNGRPQVVRLDRKLAGQLARMGDASAEELLVREMWRAFYQGTSLEGRGRGERGYDLRASWMPKRFWAGLPELCEVPAPQPPT